MGIQNYFIQKKIQKIIEKSKTELKTTIQKINKIATIVDENSAFNYQFFKELQKKLQLDDTHFEILTIKHKKSNYNEFKGNVFLTNDINWKGDINTSEINDFLAQQYDLLIDTIAQDEPLKLLIVAQTKAVLKAGFATNNPELYNIQINVDAKRMDIFIDELVKYLKILKVI